MAGLLAGSASWFVGRAPEGPGWMERSLELAPESLVHHWALGYHYRLLGRAGERERYAAWVHDRQPSVVYTRQLRALVAALQGRPDEARTILAAVDVSGLDGHQLFHVAESIITPGDTVRRIAGLELASDRSFPRRFHRRALSVPRTAGARGRVHPTALEGCAARRRAQRRKRRRRVQPWWQPAGRIPHHRGRFVHRSTAVSLRSACSQPALSRSALAPLRLQRRR